MTTLWGSSPENRSGRRRL